MNVNKNIHFLLHLACSAISRERWKQMFYANDLMGLSA